MIYFIFSKTYFNASLLKIMLSTRNVQNHSMCNSDRKSGFMSLGHLRCVCCLSSTSIYSEVVVKTLLFLSRSSEEPCEPAGKRFLTDPQSILNTFMRESSGKSEGAVLVATVNV